MLPNIGAPELIIILVIALLILGPGKLPEVGSSLGKSIREFRKASTDIQDSVKLDVDTSPLPADAAPPRRARRTGCRGPAAVAAPPPIRRRPLARLAPTSDSSTVASSRSRSKRPWQTPTPCSSRVSPVVRIPDPEPSPPPALTPGDETVMSLVDHLTELRNRLFKSILAVAIARPSASTSRPTSASSSRRWAGTVQVLVSATRSRSS